MMTDDRVPDADGFTLRADVMPGVEILQATVKRHIFDPHFHDSYLIGFTRAGVEQFHQDGKPALSSAGKIRLIEPGVVHTGAPFGDLPWSYAAFYVSPAAFADLDADQGAPRFADAVVDDPDLFSRGLALATAFHHRADIEARQQELASLLIDLIRRHARPGRQAEPRIDRDKIGIARRYISERMDSVVRLDDVAAAAGLSKFHLLRSFKAATGLTPWRYQVQLRLSVARDLLRHGMTAAQVAHSCGFFDQSHFTRLFRASYGMTPAAFGLAFRASLAPRDDG